MVRRPGVEPGSTAWKATMLTVTPPTPLGKASQNYLVNQTYCVFFCGVFSSLLLYLWQRLRSNCLRSASCFLQYCQHSCKSYNCCTCYAILSSIPSPSLVTRGNSWAVSRRKSRRLVNDHACVCRFLFLIHRLRTTYNFNLGKIKE